MPIKVLAPEIAGKIAAGEVVEGPASVVKELVENSLDAGASQVRIEAQGGGVSSIRVTDNGCSIPLAEVELAFQRHATSKIDELADLENISSLGFRGEALPSIAAMAKVEMLTKAASDAVGSYLHLRDGAVVDRGNRARVQGTTITIHRLFRHFPARFKFLKSATTENSHIAHVVSRYALAFPEVRFSLSLNGRLALHTQGNGNLQDVVAEIYGWEIAQNMLRIAGLDSFPKVSGLISPPSSSRSSRSYISFFVNRRWVQSRLLARAVEQAYQGRLMSDRHPMAVINISLPHQEIDVNVHPTKTEVRFRGEQAIFTAVERAVKAALAKAPLPKVKTMLSYPSPAQSEGLWTMRNGEPTAADSLPILRVMGQLTNSYIIAEGPEGLYLIDQHAAHERVLYEKLLTQQSTRKVEIQGLLEPVTIELGPKQEEVLKARSEALTEFGFNIEPFGSKSCLIRAAPAVTSGTNLREMIRALLDDLAADEAPLKWQEKVAQSLACHSAIKAGQALSNEEMRELVKQLEQTALPGTCPHGRPTMIHLSSHQLEREFGRLG